MDEQIPQPQSNPVPNPAPMPTPAPQAAPAAKPEEAIKITPVVESTPKAPVDKKKRMVFAGIGAYGLTMLLLSLLGFTFAEVAGAGLNRVLLIAIHVLFGMGILVSLVFSMFAFYKALKVPKMELEEKKRKSKSALMGGIAFFGIAIFWLLVTWFIAPKLMPAELFRSPIITDPEITIGLTAPVEIIFDATQVPIDLSKYQVISYTWDFGDGSSANGSVVSHRYTQKGTGSGRYTVNLDVIYRDLSTGTEFDGSFKTEVAIENERVAAAFIAVPDGGEVPLTVTFDATDSYDPDGEIVSYEWDFNGDGRFDDAEGMTAKYEFKQEGDFKVSLRVTDNNGEFDVTTRTIQAGSSGGLRAVITSEDVLSGDPYYVGVEYSFTGSNSQTPEGKVTKFNWNFGDGTKSATQAPSHTFDKPGAYTITLDVKDAKGNEDQTTLSVNVVEEGAAPTAVIKSPNTINGKTAGPLPFTVDFEATDSYDPDDDIINYEWDFDEDGLVDKSGNNQSYTFEEAGTYDVVLIVTDSEGNKSEAELSVEVLTQGLRADLQINSSNGEVPLTVRFDASASSYKEGNIVAYEYDFGDGNDPFVGGSSITYKYTKVGTFTAKVKVVADDGEEATDTVQIVVRPVGLTACFQLSPSTGTAPLFVSVDPSCSQGTVSAYEWNFGDGEVSFDRRPETHIYAEAGTYNITLEVTGEAGIVDAIERTLTVQ
jgi:PKD repeat protein